MVTPTRSDLDPINAKLDLILKAINDPPEGDGHPGGLKARMHASETNHLAMHATLTLLVARVTALEAGPGMKAMTWWDRVGLALLGTLLTLAAGLAGAALRGGSAPHS